MGRDKALLEWAGSRAVDRLALLAEALQVTHLVVAGGDYGLPFVLDPSPQAGPVSGIKAGVAVLRRKGLSGALVLAVDAPTLTPEDVAPLLAAPAPGAAYEGLPLPMLLSLTALPADLDDSASLRRLVAAAGLAILPAPEGAFARLRGANTPDERAALLTEPTL